MNEFLDENSWIEPEIRNFAGRDLVQEEAGRFFRGLIKRAGVRTDVDTGGKPHKFLRVYLDWVALRTSGGWKLFREPATEEEKDNGISITSINLDYSSLIKDDDGGYSFELPYIGSVQILKNGDRLQRELVNA